MQLSRAKHPSLQGHAQIARWLAKRVRFYEFRDHRFFVSDDAPADVAVKRRRGFERLAAAFAARAPRTIRLSEAAESAISDMRFTNAYRVPFPYRSFVTEH